MTKHGRMKGCPNQGCAGGGIWNEADGIPNIECPVCYGYAFVWEDGSPIDSHLEGDDLYHAGAIPVVGDAYDKGVSPTSQ